VQQAALRHDSLLASLLPAQGRQTIGRGRASPHKARLWGLFRETQGLGRLLTRLFSRVPWFSPHTTLLPRALVLLTRLFSRVPWFNPFTPCPSSHHPYVLRRLAVRRRRQHVELVLYAVSPVAPALMLKTRRRIIGWCDYGEVLD
jgi:hypothetical protein